MNMLSLPAVPNAQLPRVYEAAREALATCQNVDECKDWADKAAALASYAKQSQDDSLMVMAQRIKARAVRRAGELLAQIEPAKTGPKPELSMGTHTEPSRQDAAREAMCRRVDEAARQPDLLIPETRQAPVQEGFDL